MLGWCQSTESFFFFSHTCLPAAEGAQVPGGVRISFAPLSLVSGGLRVTFGRASKSVARGLCGFTERVGLRVCIRAMHVHGMLTADRRLRKGRLPVVCSWMLFRKLEAPSC